jgi:hypothetical protein
MSTRKVVDKWGREIVIYGDRGFDIAMHGTVQVAAGSTEQVALWLTRTASPYSTSTF